eukprot:16134_1
MLIINVNKMDVLVFLVNNHINQYTMQYLHSSTERGTETPNLKQYYIANTNNEPPIPLFNFEPESQTTTVTTHAPSLMNNKRLTLSDILRKTNHRISASSQTTSQITITQRQLRNGISHDEQSNIDIKQLSTEIIHTCVFVIYILVNITWNEINANNGNGAKQTSDKFTMQLDIIGDMLPIDISPKTIFIHKDEDKMDIAKISKEMDNIAMINYKEYIENGSIQMNIANKFVIFDVAAEQIKHMMRQDIFARFKRTNEFKNFVKTWNVKK